MKSMNIMVRAGLGLLLTVAALSAAPRAHAAGIVDEAVDGNVLTATIEIGGNEYGEIEVEFEQVAGLGEGALGLSAELLGPLDLAALASRLPASTSVPSAFQVMVTFDPQTGLEMEGVVTVSLHTENLSYSPGTLLRLFAAPVQGTFRDVTATTGAGSFRGGGGRPDIGLAQHVIVLDERSDETIAETKLDRLDDVLSTRAGLIDSALLTDLEELAAAVRAAFDEDDYGAAIGYLDDLVAEALQAPAADLPDSFEVGGSEVNVAGELRSDAAALRYTLVRLDEGS